MTLCLLVIASGLLVTGCSRSQPSPGAIDAPVVRETDPGPRVSDATPTSDAEDLGGAGLSPFARTPKETPEAAVLALLSAEKSRTRAVSYALLSASGRATYRDPEAWGTRRLELPLVTGFRLVSVDGSVVNVVVEHTPGIDPFVGLQFAQEVQSWRTQKVSDGWLVDPEPEVNPILPPVDGVRDTATKWLDARKRCDDAPARALQAVRTPFGASVAASALCGSTQSPTVAKPTSVVPGPETAALVAQYGNGVLRYVRQTQITVGTQSFTMFLVPIGAEWRVVAVND